MASRTIVDILTHLGLHRARTLLTASGLVAGIFVLVLVGSLAETFNTVLADQAELDAGTLTVYASRWDERLTAATRQEIRRVPGVAGTLVSLKGEFADPEAAEPAGFQLVTEGLTAVDSDIPGLEYGPPLITQALLRGRRPLPGATNELLVEFDLAQAHGWDVGSAVVVRGRPFVVTGILERPPFGGSREAYLDYQTLCSLLRRPTDNVSSLDVIPEPGQDPAALAERIEQAVPGTRTLTAADQAADRGELLGLGAIAGFSGVLALLAGALTVVNTMLMSVQERRAEIGLKKALGATDGDVVLEFVLEAGVLGALAGGAGLLLAWFLVLGVNTFLRAQWGLSLLTVTPRLAVVALALPVAIAMAAGAYPAWRAARQDPVRVLRNVPDVPEGRGGRAAAVRWAARRLRWLLTVGGISTGILILVIALSLAEFLNGYINGAVEATHDRMGLYPRGPASPRAAVRELERMEGVRSVVQTAWGGFLFEAGGPGSNPIAGSPVVNGMDSPTGEMDFNTPTRARVTRGRFLDPDRRNEVVVGHALAASQGLDVGDVLSIRDRDFTVVGIWEETAQDMLAGSGNAAYVSMAALRATFPSSGDFVQLTALIEPGADPEQVAGRIRERMPEWEVQTAKQAAGEMRDMMRIFTLILAAYVSLGLLAGGLSIMNTMIFSVSRRTREIGLKKAVGAGDGDVLAEVVEESGWVGLLGGVLGVAAGWLVTLAVNVYTVQTEGLRVMLVTPRLVVGALIFTTFLGMIAGLYPAVRASRLDPVQALRSE